MSFSILPKFWPLLGCVVWDRPTFQDKEVCWLDEYFLPSLLQDILLEKVGEN